MSVVVSKTESEAHANILWHYRTISETDHIASILGLQSLQLKIDVDETDAISTAVRCKKNPH